MSLCAVVERGWLFGDNDIVIGYPHFFYQVNGGETVYANCHHTHTHTHMHRLNKRAHGGDDDVRLK